MRGKVRNLLNSMDAWHKTKFLTRLDRVGIENIWIEVQQAPNCGAEATCNAHERISCLKPIDRPYVQQLAVVYSIQHTFANWNEHVKTGMRFQWCEG
jgi:hypothetical protein